MHLILFLILITNLMAQPGPIQTQEAGISNYQIQATAPTTTPVAGKKYLYNENSQLKTKDNLANIERVNKNYDNFVPNFDMEEGLLPYVFTATRAVLNTATPLEGLRSIDFDGTAINDFIETPLITLPRVLMGQTCMVKINIKGGDANLQFQLVNGAGTIIAFKQMAVFADSTPQFLTFNCPTQALITATPALGQLKIKLVQSTATNAALATLDSFYLGRFESNTMTVQGQTEVFRATGGALGGGNNLYWTTVRENTISQTGSLVNTAANGLTFTAIQPVILNITGSNYQAAGAIDAELMLNGILQMRQSQGFGQTPVSSNLVLNVGDFVRIHTSYAVGAATESNVIITATPLPQLATIVNTNTPRAGWLGQRTWANAGCAWSRTNAAIGAFPAVAACVPTNSGFVINDTVTNGQLPKITLSKLPKGKITLRAYTQFNKGTNASADASYNLALNGTLIPNSQNMVSGALSSVSAPFISFTFDNPVALDNAFIEIYGSATSGPVEIYGNNTRPLNIVVSYEPDLSDPYSIPDLFASLPPQVQNSSGKEYRTESCLVLNPAGTASLGSSSCNTFVQSVSRTGLGLVTINLIPNIFSSPPACLCNGYDSIMCGINNSTSTTSTIFSTSFSVVNAGAYADRSFNLICEGFK